MDRFFSGVQDAGHTIPAAFEAGALAIDDPAARDVAGMRRLDFGAVGEDRIEAHVVSREQSIGCRHSNRRRVNRFDFEPLRVVRVCRLDRD